MCLLFGIVVKWLNRDDVFFFDLLFCSWVNCFWIDVDFDFNWFGKVSDFIIVYKYIKCYKVCCDEFYWFYFIVVFIYYVGGGEIIGEGGKGFIVVVVEVY